MPLTPVVNADGTTSLTINHGTTTHNVNIEFNTGRPEDAQLFSKICESPKFVTWANSYGPRTEQKLVLSKIQFRYIELTDDTIGLIKLSADITRKSDSSKVPGEVIINGQSVGILIVLRVNPVNQANTAATRGRNYQVKRDSTNNTQEWSPELSAKPREYVLFVRQARSSIGSVGYQEIPSGTFDGAGALIGPAAQALQRDCGIRINAEQLIDLSSLALDRNSPGISLSPEYSDEKIRLYLYRETVSKQQIDKLKSKSVTGFDKEGRGDNQHDATIETVALGDAWRRTTDAKSICALFLFYELRYHQIMPKYRPPREPKAPATFTAVADLNPNDQGMNLKVKVYEPLTVSEVVRRDGQMTSVGQLTVGDETGIVHVKLLNDQMSLPLLRHKGASLVLRNCKLDMSAGTIVVAFDRWGKIAPPAFDETVLFNFKINDTLNVSAAEYEQVAPNRNSGYVSGYGYGGGGYYSYGNRGRGMGQRGPRQRGKLRGTYQ